MDGYYKASYAMDGADGNDTLLGSSNNDTFLFRAGSGNYGNDVVDGGGGDNTVAFSTWQGSYATSGATIDLRHGTLSGGMTSGAKNSGSMSDGAASGNNPAPAQ